jgi:hypothetical protein
VTGALGRAVRPGAHCTIVKAGEQYLRALKAAGAKASGTGEALVAPLTLAVEASSQELRRCVNRSAWGTCGWPSVSSMPCFCSWV